MRNGREINKDRADGLMGTLVFVVLFLLACAIFGYVSTITNEIHGRRFKVGDCVSQSKDAKEIETWEKATDGLIEKILEVGKHKYLTDLYLATYHPPGTHQMNELKFEYEDFYIRVNCETGEKL